MARYIQKISLGMGRERWVGWEIDGVGTEITGLILADHFSDDELAQRGVRKFIPMSFDDFLRLGAATAATEQGLTALDDMDLEFRLDALFVSMDRLRSRGTLDVTRDLIVSFFGETQPLDDPRVVMVFEEWQKSGYVLIVGRDDCYLKILRRLT